MKRAWKARLCLAFRPDAYGYRHGNYWQSCHRHAGHRGPHRAAGVWEWADGDGQSRPVRTRRRV